MQVIIILLAAAGAQGLLGLSTNDDFLPPDEAFRFSAMATAADAVSLTWEIEDGYYLYRHRVAAKTDTPGVELGAVGSSGRTTGPHLHFETLVDGRPADPRRLLDEAAQDCSQEARR